MADSICNAIDREQQQVHIFVSKVYRFLYLLDANKIQSEEQNVLKEELQQMCIKYLKGTK
jgi:hypothetical protein